MKVRWLGNACLEVFGDKHILIDPNFTVEPKKEADIVLLTHEHDDHFSLNDFKEYGGDKELYAPETCLEKFAVDGEPVEVGDEINDIDVLDCDCYGSEESVSYFHNGLLHSGDSNVFPEVNKDVKAVFTACFQDYFDDYISAFKRLDPDIVVPFHYDPSEGQKDADALEKRMNMEGIPNRVLMPGDSIEV